ncbi:hypothetical protein FZC79_09035 [Rossellomorea vietnamensis]|uniref:Uncharacterized protein n=2 Tax=Rossellomorea TaxID=2837508 RepID=A0A5D4KEM3_9BACI|nr:MULTISPECIES: hypothetical protein [Rossellomorea]TYR75758.1 hypothetical protein FZC79_09035 [Rossellomorea vietnamensis]TYS80965.1 hypothetical protein FZC80_07625 [Rossellomorea aquimaris]
MMNRTMFLAILLSFAFLANSIGVSHVPVKAVHEASSIEQFAHDKLLAGEYPDLKKGAVYPFASLIAGAVAALLLMAYGNHRSHAGNRIRMLLMPVLFGANYLKLFSLNDQFSN